MKKTIKVTYPEIPNMGDLLNPLIIEKVFGYEVKSSNVFTSDMVAIGSGLGGFQWNHKSPKIVPQIVANQFSRDLHVWGTGFIHGNEDQIQQFFRKNVNFHALRGNKTKARVQRIINKDLNIPLGDAGLLASELITLKRKEYKVGIIPHFKEQENDVFKQIKEKFTDSTIIDLKEDPIKVLEDISSCEVVISSSLHGLIVADSFNIPNIYVKASDVLMGDGFKFEDYYSAFDLECKAYNPSEVLKMSVTDIIENYEIDANVVAEKKLQLKNCFPNF